MHSIVAFAPKKSTQTSLAQSVIMVPSREKFYIRILKWLNIWSWNSQQKKTVTKFNTAILRHMQPSSRPPLPYTGDLVTKSCKIAGVYDEGKLNENFIEGVEAVICHRLRQYSARNPRAELTDISFQPESLLSIQNRAGSTSHKIQNNCNQGKPFERKPWNSRNSQNKVNKSTISPSQKLKRRSTSPPVLHTFIRQLRLSR